MSLAALDAAPRSATAAGGQGGADYPAALPAVLASTGNLVLCAVGDGTDDATVVTSAALPLPAGAKVMPVGRQTDERVADEVYVPPGTGTLVRERVGAGGPTGTTYLVTDAGLKYPVPSADAVAALGYGGVTGGAGGRNPAGAVADRPEPGSGGRETAGVRGAGRCAMNGTAAGAASDAGRQPASGPAHPGRRRRGPSAVPGGRGQGAGGDAGHASSASWPTRWPGSRPAGRSPAVSWCWT